MSSVIVLPPSLSRNQGRSGSGNIASPLPQLLQTPLGLALLELQGSINHPPIPADAAENDPDGSLVVGRLVFPDYKGEEGEGKWTKRVWLYVGEHQRLTGEVKKLPKPLGVLRRAGERGGETNEMQGVLDDGAEGAAAADAVELEIAEVVKWKIVFSSRPEPVGVV